MTTTCLMIGESFEKISHTRRLSRFDTRTRGYMLTNYGKILARSSMGYVCNRADSLDGSDDDNNRSSYAESLMIYFRDDKGIDAQPGQVSKRKRTPKQIEDEWAEMGKSLKKLNKRGVKDYRLLEPGWAGELEDDQVAYIRSALHDDPELAYQWGFKRSTKRFNTDIIRRIAEKGDADHRMVNVNLVKGQSN
jgi:hypothetical protein